MVAPRSLMTLGILFVALASAPARQDPKKQTLTPLPGAEQSIDDLIMEVRALRRSGDLSKHQDHVLLRLALKADEEFDEKEFSDSLKALNRFQSAINKELGDGSISQSTFDTLNSLNSTALALVSGQQAKPTLGVSAASCMMDSSDPNKINLTWTVSWTNQNDQFSAKVTVTALWTTAQGALLGSSLDLAPSNLVGGGAAKPTNDFPGTGSVTRAQAPQGAGGAQFKITITNAKTVNNVAITPDPASATTDVCTFGS
jgi:hypothetical protein